MVFSKFFIILLSLKSFYLMAEQVPLKTKQAIDYIRYLSTDGQSSYYQNKNGELFYSSFYNTKPILKKSPLDQFYVTVDQGYSLIEHIPNYYNIALHEKNHAIYSGKVGDEPTLIGQGLSPELHSQFGKLTYLDKLTKELIIYDLSFKKITTKINLEVKDISGKNLNIQFFTRNDVIYSDFNNKNEKIYVYLSLLDNSRKLVFKANSAQYTLESCVIDKQLIVGQFPINNLKMSTEIIAIDLYNNKNFSNFKQIYSSELADLGSMICKDSNIYFIKAFKKNINLQSRMLDAVKLDSKTKLLTRLSTLNNISSIFITDKLILTFYKGEYLILDGTQILDDKLEKDKK